MKQLVDLESMNKLIVVRLDQQFSHYGGILEQICLDRKTKWSKSVYKTDIAGVYDWREPDTADNESWEPSSVCSHLQVGDVKLSKLL